MFPQFPNSLGCMMCISIVNLPKAILLSSASAYVFEKLRDIAITGHLVMISILFHSNNTYISCVSTRHKKVAEKIYI